MSNNAAVNEDYSGGANIVRQSARQIRTNEPSGESESLRGRKLDKMGSKAERKKAPSVLKREELEKKGALMEKKRNKGVSLMGKKRINVNEGVSILDVEVQSSQIYKPKTKETRQVYDQILHIIRAKLGDNAPEIIEDVANEVIAILKLNDLNANQKKKEISAIFSVDDGLFSKLLNFSKSLKDYGFSNLGQDESEIEAVGKDLIMPISIDELDGGNEEVGEMMAVLDEIDENDDYVKDIGFDEDDDENDRILDDSDEDKEGYLKVDQEDEGMQEDGEFEDDLREIDAFWLSTKLNDVYQDPVKSKTVQSKALEILSIQNEIKCQNELIQLLGIDNFELIKKIFENRTRVYYFTKLGEATNDEEKEKILIDMKNDENAVNLLNEIEKANKSETEETKNILSWNLMKEAKSLKRLAEEAKKQKEKFSKIQNLDNSDFAKLNKTVINLDNLKFIEGNHQMSNEKCLLPPGSHKQKQKGYEEVYIPPASKSKKNSVKLIKISSLPSWTHEAFDSSVRALNPIQSRVYKAAFKSAHNLLICAPTGAGKTNIALLTILQQIGLVRDKRGNIDLNKFKVVYVAPMKALVSEIVGSFSRRLKPYGVKVREMTGDMQLSRREVEETQVIIATPEKWDIVTRKSGDKIFLDTIKLLIIDEIHLLHDARGPVLESIVARTMRHTEKTGNHVRIVGLSATLPNYVDVASFLRIDAKKGLFYFDGSFRPIPLEQRYIGITNKKGMKRLMLMKEILYETVMERVTKQQILIFVHSRADTGRTGRELKDQAYANDELSRFFTDDGANREVLEAEASNVSDAALKELLPFGIGIHHAGLCRDDRNLVEDLFSDNRLQILISTATLAWGVNLPARTVIIKGTKIYSPEKGKWIELSPQDMLQMLGRAGRPRLDTKGEGIIITGHSELKFYLSLINNQLPIESQFISQLADQLNAEIVLGTISTLKDAVDWLSYTYLYTRMMKDPQTYGLTAEDVQEDKLLIKFRSNLVHSAALVLNRHNLIRYDKKAGTFTPTTLGRIASHYYIKHPSIAIYSEHIRKGMDMIELFRIFSLSSEFKYIPVRDSEKIELERLLSTVPIPVRGAQDDPRTKINVLLQAHISKMRLDGYALKADMVYVTQSAARIMRGLFEVFLKRGWANVAENCLSICKMIDKQQWSCMTPLRQYSTIPEKIFRRIENQEHLTWEHFYNMTPQQVGSIIKFEKMGREVHKLIHQFPRLKLNAYVQPLTRSRIKVELSIQSEFQWIKSIHGGIEPFWIFVTDVDDEVLLHSQFFVLPRKQYKKELVFEFTIPLLEPLHPQYFVKVMSDRWLHCQTVIPISFKNLLLPAKFPPCTELVEMRSIPVSHFESKNLVDFLKARRISVLNQIQTQMFDALYNQFENVFIGAPGNSGKTTAAMLALARLFEEDTNRKAKALFLAPTKEILSRNVIMLNQLCKIFQRTACILTGVTKTDLQSMKKCDLIISTAEHWDNISRRWRARKVTHSIRIVIMEHIHMLNNNSSAYEVVCSRMRYMYAELETKVRFIAISASIANSKDVYEWLGIQPDFVFNFHPKNRPIPLNLYIQAFDHHEPNSRFYAMTRSLYQTLNTRCKKNELIMIFVSDKKSARLTASHLASYAIGSGEDQKFLYFKHDEYKFFLKDAIDQIRDAYLKFYLAKGIGYIYEGMNKSYEMIVTQLYKLNIIQVLIQTHSMSWSSDLRANTVVILDVKEYNGKEGRYLDYPLNEMLEMIGRAGRPNFDRSSNCVLLCHSAIKAHLKKFLFDPIPVESHLHNYLAEHINAEIASGTIENKQDCMDWLAWTFFYRRLQQNPNYYNLLGVTDSHKNEHLSELIETAVEDLNQAECIIVEDDYDLASINGGMISSYYYIHIATVNLFFQSIDSGCKWRLLLEILSASREFEDVRIGKNEDNLLRSLAAEAIHKPKKPSFSDPAVKTNLLIQSHLKRGKLTPEFLNEKNRILPIGLKLIQAMTDCISYNGWLKPTIMAMKLSQMIVQGMWITDSPLKQLPYFDDNLIKRCENHEIETIGKKNILLKNIDDLMDMEDEDRVKMLNLKENELSHVAKACNRYPDLELEVDSEITEIMEGEEEIIKVKLTRVGLEEDEELGEVICFAYPFKKSLEYWWIVVGDPKKNKVVGIKRVNFEHEIQTKVKITGPEPGDYNFTVYLICDSYVGCDQESDPFKVNVIPATS